MLIIAGGRLVATAARPVGRGLDLFVTVRRTRTARRALDGLEGCGAPQTVTTCSAQGAGRSDRLVAEDRFVAAERAGGMRGRRAPARGARHDADARGGSWSGPARFSDPGSTEVPA